MCLGDGQVQYNADEWKALIGEDGPMMAMILAAIRQMPIHVFVTGIARLERQTTISPPTNPGVYLDGRRFRNTREYTEILRSLEAVRHLLNEIPS